MVEGKGFAPSTVRPVNDLAHIPLHGAAPSGTGDPIRVNIRHQKT